MRMCDTRGISRRAGMRGMGDTSTLPPPPTDALGTPGDTSSSPGFFSNLWTTVSTNVDWNPLDSPVTQGVIQSVTDSATASPTGQQLLKQVGQAPAVKAQMSSQAKSAFIQQYGPIGAVAIGAGAVYFLAKKNYVVGALAGVGAWWAYTQSKKA